MKFLPIGLLFVAVFAASSAAQEENTLRELGRTPIPECKSCPYKVPESAVRGSPVKRKQGVEIVESVADARGISDPVFDLLEIDMLVWEPCIFEAARRAVLREPFPNTDKLVNLVLELKKTNPKEQVRTMLLPKVKGHSWVERLALYDTAYNTCRSGEE